MKNNRVAFIALLTIILFCQYTPVFAEGAVLGRAVGITSGVAVSGCGSFYLVQCFRHVKRERVHGDSIIMNVSVTVDSSVNCFLRDDYIQSEKYLQQVVSVWDEYQKYCKKRKIKEKISRDSLEVRISDCKLLQSLSRKFQQVDEMVAPLPVTAEELVLRKRNDVVATLKKAENAIKIIEESSGVKQPVVHHGFRKAIQRIKSVDSLFADTYESEKLNFMMKNKFFYNRAVDSRDTSLIREFVDDCEYYQIDKDWCEKAQSSLSTGIIAENTVDYSRKSSKKNSVKPIKLNPVDSMHNDYKKAIDAKNIALLEQYVTKYAKRKFKKNEIKIDSVKTLLNALKKQNQEEIAYQTAHAYVSTAGTDKIQISLESADEAFLPVIRDAVNKLGSELTSASGIRLPVNVALDRGENGLRLFLSGYVHPQKDIMSSGTDSGTVIYTLEGCRWGVEFLHKLKNGIIEELKKSPSLKPDLKQEYLNNIAAAVYIVRLSKNEVDNITMYAYCLQKENCIPEFYTFFDISSSDVKNERIVNDASYLIKLFDNDQDLLKKRLVGNFFRK